MNRTYENLTLAALTPEQHANTCGYWYTVTDGATPHTAFRTKEAAISWLRALGLSIDDELPKTRGEHAVRRIRGRYRREMVICSAETFAELPGMPVALLSNGSYTTGKLHTDIKKAMRVLYEPSPNCAWRDKHDHRECGAMKDEGLTVI